MEALLALDDFRLDEILDQLALFGATSVRLLPENFRLSLLREAQGYTYQPEEEIVGSGENAVRQQLGTFEDFPPHSKFILLKDAFRKALVRSLRGVAPYPFENALDLNVMVLQKYERGSLGITPHRDRLVYTNLICIFVIGGRGRFYVCADRSGRDARNRRRSRQRHFPARSRFSRL